ncbi:MAG: glycosyltransferase [Lachnospiraceae bacterium]|nr:glycosyltransferase [Lachnospiraceae bacterium]MDE7239147.1 glycosyltransferase [Lachnospiraceae bacterium]
MPGNIKQTIQEIKIRQCKKEHDKEVERQADRYPQWVISEEPKQNDELYLSEPVGDMAALPGAQPAAEERKLKSAVIGFDELAAGVHPFDGVKQPIVVLADTQAGVLSARAQSRVTALFAAHSDWDMIYGDEDHCFAKNRFAPWMKPDYSPDTLLSFPYFGGFAAFRLSSYGDVMWIDDAAGKVRVYDFLLKCSEREKKIVHVPEVFFHRTATQEQYAAYRAIDRDDPRMMTADDCMPWALPWEDQEDYREIRLQAMKRRGYAGELVPDAFGILQPVYEIKDNTAGKKPLVSIIIPSKDNVDVLERCIRSVRAHEAYPHYEILVVDNGSAGAVRTRMKNLEREFSFSYYYEPMEFNFSQMINLGVSKARGDYLLLLNDDCEVTQDDWLLKMLGQAQLPHVGAVGAKLIYPDSDLIQHAGVTNLTAGPAHKLQRDSDSHSYYYGRNRFCYDYIGVTAACMMVARDRFEAVGGFDEGLRVAFNDVDFCFKLYERGLYQVMRNDVVLYHHESLSRGDDLLTEEKTMRLMQERDLLYERHPQLTARDPFYSVNLLGCVIDYLINYQYEYDRGDTRTGLLPEPVEVQPEWYNECLIVMVDRAVKKDFMDVLTKQTVYQIEGWAYVLGQDNCRYTMSILLKKEDGTFIEAETLRRYRPDAVKILPEQKNIELSGFVACLPPGALPPGDYPVYLLFRDQCSRQRLLRDTGSVLKVDEDGK